MITERHARRVAAQHAELVKAAIALVREHGDYIGVTPWSNSRDFNPDDEEGVCLTIEGDTAELHFTSDNYEKYASSFVFDARTLWSRKALAAAIKGKRQEWAEAAARQKAQEEARQRATFEALKHKFEPTGSLRGDIRRAIEVEAAAAEEPK